MIDIPLKSLSQLEKTTVCCDDCFSKFQRTRKNIRVNRMKFGRDLCTKCANQVASKKRPQCSPEYWNTPERKNQHSEALKNSIAHSESRKTLNLSGERNGMFGKKHRPESRAKMSKSRIGKVGSKATAWKGGRQSLNRRVKQSLQRKNQWFSRIIERDKICSCGSNGKLDAHHIKPISTIIRELLQKHNISIRDASDETFLWLIQQPEILNDDLTNGIAVCRPCHRKIHHNWGSHRPIITCSSCDFRDHRDSSF